MIFGGLANHSYGGREEDIGFFEADGSGII